MTITVYDAAMAGILVAGMIWGAIRGITWQIASMASLVLGYMVAFPLSAQIAPHFPGTPIVARALALLASYAGVSAAVFGAAWLVRTTLREWKFEAFDRHLGMLLGGLEGATLGLVATVFVVSLAPQERTRILTSPTGHIVCRVLDVIEPVLPGEIRAELSPFWSGNPDAPATATATAPEPTRTPFTQGDAATTTPDPAATTTSRVESAAASAAAQLPDIASQGTAVLKNFLQNEEKSLEQALSENGGRTVNQAAGKSNGTPVERR
jgi:uncharacterized membrane protein required for colicin V production